MILSFSGGRIEVTGIRSAAEQSHALAAAERVLPYQQKEPGSNAIWRIELCVSNCSHIEDFPGQRKTVIQSCFELTEHEWRRLLRATCQRVLIASGLFGLHAVVASLDDKLVAIAGTYGTGKTSVGEVLCTQGARLLASDYMVIGWQGAEAKAVVMGGTRPTLLRAQAEGADTSASGRFLTGMASVIDTSEVLTAIVYLESNQRGRHFAHEEHPEVSRRTLTDLYLNASTGFDQVLERFHFPLSILNSSADQMARFTLVERLVAQVQVTRARGNSQFLADLISGVANASKFCP